MSDRINELRKQLRDALVEEGVMDRATADAVLLPARAPQPDLVGNMADLQRMGSVALQDRIPTPLGEDDEEASDIQAAFKEPPDLTGRGDAGARQASEAANSGAMQQSSVKVTVEADAPGGTEGAAPEGRGGGGGGGGDAGAAAEAEADTEGDGGLESMTKAELMDEANRRGVAVNQSMTKSEIIAELEA